jgi:hypothetical protein
VPRVRGGHRHTRAGRRPLGERRGPRWGLHERCICPGTHARLNAYAMHLMPMLPILSLRYARSRPSSPMCSTYVRRSCTSWRRAHALFSRDHSADSTRACDMLTGLVAALVRLRARSTDVVAHLGVVCVRGRSLGPIVAAACRVAEPCSAVTACTVRVRMAIATNFSAVICVICTHVVDVYGPGSGACAWATM